ncbi:phage terminase large subunit [Bradyrhizobium pachyrhizi]|uniref:phage terminase large subunit n=1 Tax=Bradyrhizobium pachyrhizi TaxID=280333 RepID=UPI001FD8F483|nr:phage terminase large subunit [Bradyrhizobium pachyrhizi]
MPVFTGPAMYRGSYGGRGSGKTRTFATMAAVHGARCAAADKGGVVVCGREFMNSLADSSFAEVKAAIESNQWLTSQYDVGEKYIRTRDGKIDFAFVGIRHNLDSLKSKARIRLLWIDEAEPTTETGWLKIDPTVREEDAEIWVTWNPESEKSPTHKRFREKPPPHCKIVEMNWRDNPWFPSTLNVKRLNDLENRADQYNHIWEGGFRTNMEGAYFASLLTQAKLKGRIGAVEADPLLPLRAFIDIGGAGANADAFVIWIVQWVGQEIRVLDHYEAVGQVLGAHVAWLRKNGYENALIYLPHDGVNVNNITGKRYEDHLRDAGFKVEPPIKNQGKGAASMRIEAVRRLGSKIWFNEKTTKAGRDALGYYHEKQDEQRKVGLGPEHDWSSHSADAFGLMAVAYEEPGRSADFNRKIAYPGQGYA